MHLVLNDSLKKIVLFSFVLLFGVLFTSCEKQENCEENLDNECNCPIVFNPVCGCNNETYGNPCLAQCFGVTGYTAGRCD